ncbi:MAG: septal ring lytic transglycosylase RlpA family protein [Rubrivivax sp.]
MSRHFLVAIGASALLTLASLAQAQQASAPAPAAAPVAPAASAASAAPPSAAAAPDAMEGRIAYYGNKFAGRKTASGQRFSPNALTMAHKTLPFGSEVRVTNLKNNKSVVVRVNDRGPTTPDRIGDLSLAAARKIGMVGSGVVDARIEVVSMGKQR